MEFNPSSFDEEIARARAQSDRDKRLSYIAEGLGDIFTSGAVARGGKGIDPSFFQNLRKDSDRGVIGKENEKKAALADWYKQKTLERTGKMDQLSFDKFEADRSRQASEDEWRQKQYEANQKRDARDYEQRERQISSSNELRRSQQEQKLAKEQQKIAKEDAGIKEKKDKELRERTVGPGLVARTKEDAKTLKTATELKTKLDRTLGEMISLRKEYGTEYLDTNAVSRGKQLSKDLLLTYKNLAKLGVLSKSDEDIINAIIPADPLGHDWNPLQDSILHVLEKFQGDISSDFEASMKTRLDPDSSRPSQQQSNMVVVTDGKETLQIPVEDLEDAKKDGFSTIDPNTFARQQ